VSARSAADGVAVVSAEGSVVAEAAVSAASVVDAAAVEVVEQDGETATNARTPEKDQVGFVFSWQIDPER
jgi:hypothetical protein